MKVISPRERAIRIILITMLDNKDINDFTIIQAKATELVDEYIEDLEPEEEYMLKYLKEVRNEIQKQ
jgi:hypothetical protein